MEMPIRDGQHGFRIWLSDQEYADVLAAACERGQNAEQMSKQAILDDLAR